MIMFFLNIALLEQFVPAVVECVVGSAKIFFFNLQPVQNSQSPFSPCDNLCKDGHNL